jgi:hypothetical protein
MPGRKIRRMKRIIWVAGLLALFVSGAAAQEPGYRELIGLAEKSYEKQEYQKSAWYYDEAFKIQKGKAGEYYNAGCSWAMAGDKEKASGYLNQAVDLGWLNINHLKKDTDLNILHDSKEWADLLKKLQQKVDAYESHLNKNLMRELEGISESDQRYRLMMDSVQKAYGWDSEEMKELWAKQNYADSVNLIRVKQIIKEYGYPGKSLVGEQASTAWLVIQHADLATQEEYLPVLQEAASKGELPKSDFALLVDRIRMRKGEKQLYGSQLELKDGKYVFYPIEDEPNVDKRRAEMDLVPLEEYAGHFGIEYKKSSSQ